MVRITKIFHFEMAHAICGYEGRCKNIHGHSYELFVTVRESINSDNYLSAPGFIIDFKELKQIVQSTVINQLDHQLLLSRKYIDVNPKLSGLENLTICEMEPSAENLALYIREKINRELPDHLRLAELKLYETKDSYAHWIE